MSGKPVDPLPSGSDAAFRALFEQEVVGVGQADTGGRIVSANPRLAHMLGYAPGELLGLTFDDITHPDSRPESRTRCCRSSWSGPRRAPTPAKPSRVSVAGGSRSAS